MRLALLSGLMLMAALWMTGACGDGERVRGLVVEVQGGSITELESLKIRDDAGRLWAFKAEGFVGFTPSHLREHQDFLLPVTVHYKETPEGLLIVSIAD